MKAIAWARSDFHHGLLAAAACVLLSMSWAAPLHAGETGSISGVVKDAQGGVLPGAQVKVSGDLLSAGRSATTSSLGTYSFQRLLPGRYKVAASLTGLGSASRELRVQVDVDSQVDLVLSPTVAEEITVSADAPTVDLRSTEVNFNYTGEEIQKLPLERSYRGLFQLAPGIADNRSIVGPSGGGSRQDNTYLIDGVNITNPGFGYLSTEVNELDLAEFNVKRGAISAEFGRSAGFVANAVSKSGTNELRGSARFEFMPKDLIGEFEDPTFQDALLSTVLNPAIGLGGPFVKDKLFWYGSARYFKEERFERKNTRGDVLPNQERSGHELYGKVTATLARHLLAVSFRDRPNEITNASLSSGTAASVSTTEDNGSQIATASWSFFPTERTLLEAKYLYLKEENVSTPDTDLGLFPTFDVRNLSAMGQFFDPALNLTVGGQQFSQRINYTRHEIKAQVRQFFDLGKTEHELKAGFGYEFGEEDLLREANGWGLISRLTVSGQARVRARYYPDQPAQLGQGRTYSIFFQDTVRLGQRLTVNAGVLLNRDEFAQDLGDAGRNTFLKFAFGDEVQPRLGFNYNLRQGRGDKVYANWGRFYNMDQKSSGRSLAPRRIFQRDALFDAATGALVSDTPRASTTGKLIDPDLKPTYNDEFLAGYATPIGNTLSVDVFFQYRKTKNFIEDVPTALPDIGPFAAGNLPCTLYVGCRGADARRTYKAFTVEINRSLAERWGFNASYTWSRLEGNFDLDYSVGSVFNTSSIIQDGPGTLVQDPFRQGPLSQDRPHVFKLFANFVPVERLTLGAYLRVQSGTPWNARGRDFEGTVLNYLEPAGANRNPTWTNLDLLAAYRLDLSARARVTFEARLLNAAGNQTRLGTEAQQFLDLNTLSAPPWFAPYRQANPLFGTANSFAPPRRLLLAARVDF